MTTGMKNPKPKLKTNEESFMESIQNEWREFKEKVKFHKQDILVLVGTFFAGVFVGTLL